MGDPMICTAPTEATISPASETLPEQWHTHRLGHDHVACVLHVQYVQGVSGMSATESTSQNITIRLDRGTLRRAKVLAAKRNTSISGLLAQQIETLVGEDDAYEQAQRRALALLDRGFHLGGRIEATRDEWHER